ncbi:MAG: hypothetical protein ABR925_09020 [Acidimicrobiales bacterium]
MNTEEQIAEFIGSELLDDAAPSGDPLATGKLDSLAIEVLIAWTEDTFEISLTHEDVIAENFAGVRALSALVDAKRAGAAGQPCETPG